ncbi:hypothetical protein [Bradyrhizobium sp. MOS003]|uniref:hypothetical protein n=1 Tax=Bradyrhizobium sp. MOS003 TaxID=2133946 RepID=UPI0011BF7B49|nr:hypothetical protein [Bradyrhizobium sp. MOS003]
MAGKAITHRRMDKHVRGINQRLKSHGVCRNPVFENGRGGFSLLPRFIVVSHHAFLKTPHDSKKRRAGTRLFKKANRYCACRAPSASCAGTVRQGERRMYRAKLTVEFVAIGDRVEFWGRPYSGRARCEADAKRSSGRMKRVSRRFGRGRLRVDLKIVEIAA